MTPWHHRIGTRLNLIIALVCAIAIVGLWLTTLQRISSERGQAIAAAMKSNSNLAIAFEQQVFRTLKAAEQVAAFVREQYQDQDGQIDLQQWISQRIIREEMFNIVSVVNETGSIVSSSQITGTVNYHDREFFQAQLVDHGDELFISPPVFGRISGRWQIPMSLRIQYADGSFGGVVVMSVDPSNFTEFYLHADLGRRGLLELTGLDGSVYSRKMGDDGQYTPNAIGLASTHRQQEPDGSFVDDGSHLDGVQRIVSYRSMTGYPLVVTVGTCYTQELAPVMQRRTYYLLAAGCATAVLLGFAWLLMLTLSRQRAAADALQSSESLYRATFHQAAMGIAHISPDGRILRANEKFCLMLGYESEELLDKTLFDLSDEDNQVSIRQFLKHRLSAYSAIFSPEMEKPYRRKDGSTLWVCEALGVVRDAQGKPDFLVVVTQDITARKDLEAKLAHDAMHDSLTGLPNRVMFHDRLNRVLESARRHQRLAAVLYVDLDGFKAVNDNHGHTVGDMLLQQVAQRLADCMRAEDTVSRFGGDEFGIVLTSLSQAQDCETVGAKVIEAVSAPFDLDGIQVSVSASVGAAVYPLHGNNAAKLVSHADAAMYAAKKAGKNRFSWDSLPGKQTDA